MRTKKALDSGGNARPYRANDKRKYLGWTYDLYCKHSQSLPLISDRELTHKPVVVLDPTHSRGATGHLGHGHSYPQRAMYDDEKFVLINMSKTQVNGAREWWLLGMGLWQPAL
jgi:hypothetical protein